VSQSLPQPKADLIGKTQEHPAQKNKKPREATKEDIKLENRKVALQVKQREDNTILYYYLLSDGMHLSIFI